MSRDAPTRRRRSSTHCPSRSLVLSAHKKGAPGCGRNLAAEAATSLQRPQHHCSGRNLPICCGVSYLCGGQAQKSLVLGDSTCVSPSTDPCVYVFITAGDPLRGCKKYFTTVRIRKLHSVQECSVENLFAAQVVNIYSCDPISAQ
jgi:hypothetical protein